MRSEGEGEVEAGRRSRDYLGCHLRDEAGWGERGSLGEERRGLVVIADADHLSEGVAEAA